MSLRVARRVCGRSDGLFRGAVGARRYTVREFEREDEGEGRPCRPAHRCPLSRGVINYTYPDHPVVRRGRPSLAGANVTASARFRSGGRADSISASVCSSQH